MARTKEELKEWKAWRFAVAGIVVLACIALMILPVAAEIDSYTVTNDETGGYVYMRGITLMNGSVWQSYNSVDISTHGYCQNNQSFSGTSVMCSLEGCTASDATYMGTVDIEWDCEFPTALGTIDYHLSNFNYNTSYMPLNNSQSNIYFSSIGYVIPVYNQHGFLNMSPTNMASNPYRIVFQEILQWTGYGDYEVNYGEVPTGYCAFNLTPTYGDSPLLITVTDTSTTSPTVWNYTIFDNSTGLPVITSTVKDWQAYINGASKTFDFMMNSTGAGGNCNLFYPNYILTSSTSAVKVYVDVKDITTGQYISNAGAGIYNGTDNSWYNKSALGGMATFTGTGNLSQYPLMIGETVMLGASAPGYVAAYPQSAEMDNTYGYYNLQITVPNQIVTIYLIPAVLIPAPSTCNLLVHVTKNDPAHADWRTGSLDFFDATVDIAGTGFSPVTKKTDTSGMANFYNITATNESFLAVSASDPFYIPQTQNVQCLLNLTANASFSMVMLGETPVPTTGVPVKTTRIPTATVTATGTNPNTGAPLSTEETAALGVFSQLAQVIGTWANVAIGIVSIWLLWILVYEMTGGKTLDKIMKRGRR